MINTNVTQENVTPISRRRTRLESREWEKVRQLMPRKEGTRGVQFDVLEFLFEHLYERVTEDQLREYLLKKKSHQPQGDFVKSAINSAIKELQRLREQTFEILKIQEPTVEGVKRFVQLEFTQGEAIISQSHFLEYLEDLTVENSSLMLRIVAFIPAHAVLDDFPIGYWKCLNRQHLQAVTNHPKMAKHLINKKQLYYVPASPAMVHYLLFYENPQQEQPFLAFIGNTTNNRQNFPDEYIVWRGEDKLSKLQFVHRSWLRMMNLSLTQVEFEKLQKAATKIHNTLADVHSNLDESAILQGLLYTKIQEKMV